MIIHCAASVASVCYRCHCPLRRLAYKKKKGHKTTTINATCAPKVTLNTNTRTYEWYVQTYVHIRVLHEYIVL